MASTRLPGNPNTNQVAPSLVKLFPMKTPLSWVGFVLLWWIGFTSRDLKDKLGNLFFLKPSSIGAPHTVLRTLRPLGEIFFGYTLNISGGCEIRSNCTFL